MSRQDFSKISFPVWIIGDSLQRTILLNFSGGTKAFPVFTTFQLANKIAAILSKEEPLTGEEIQSPAALIEILERSIESGVGYVSIDPAVKANLADIRKFTAVTKAHFGSD